MTQEANRRERTTPDRRSVPENKSRTRFGQTGEVEKTDLRVEAHGACEEANAILGVTLANGGLPLDVQKLLTSLQQDLYDLEADLMAPPGAPSRDDDPVVRITDAHVERLRRAYAHYNQDLEPVEIYVLPGGTLPSSHLFHSRAVVRRAERLMWRVIDEFDDVNPLVATYLNSLSSLLFVLARVSNAEHGDVMWRPLSSVATTQQAGTGPSAVDAQAQADQPA